MADRVERVVVLPGAPEAVWVRITEGLSEWFGAEVELEARAGGRATFRWPDGRVRGAIVEEVVPPVRFAFRWLPFERAEGRVRLVPAGRVGFDLEEIHEGVRLRVHEETLGQFRSSSAELLVRTR